MSQSDVDSENKVMLETEKEKIEQKVPKVILEAKDYLWLKKNRYEEKKHEFKTVYILQHKLYPDKIVELRAASPVHACYFIHWKPNQVRILGEKEAVPDLIDIIQAKLSSSNTVTSFA